MAARDTGTEESIWEESLKKKKTSNRRPNMDELRRAVWTHAFAGRASSSCSLDRQLAISGADAAVREFNERFDRKS